MLSFVGLWLRNLYQLHISDTFRNSFFRLSVVIMSFACLEAVKKYCICWMWWPFQQAFGWQTPGQLWFVQTDRLIELMVSCT